MKYLVDTCVLSEGARKAAEPSVVRWLASTDEESLAVSSLTLGEIDFGVQRLADGRRRRSLLRWLTELEAQFADRVLPVDVRAARRWATLRATAAARGASFPVVDGLIAATALVHDLVLVTRNVDDFRATGVTVLDPWRER